jgi:hypothetical protein
MKLHTRHLTSQLVVCGIARSAATCANEPVQCVIALTYHLHGILMYPARLYYAQQVSCVYVNGHRTIIDEVGEQVRYEVSGRGGLINSVSRGRRGNFSRDVMSCPVNVGCWRRLAGGLARGGRRRGHVVAAQVEFETIN